MGSTPDGNAVRSQRTRGRILAEALRLFNEHGEARVTTGMVADALGISPGNLYYHFRNKDEIVARLFEEFERRVDVRAAASGGGAEAIEDLWLYLHLMLEAIWDYRFLYRSFELLARDRRLRMRFNRIVEGKQRALAGLCQALVRAGAMRARPEELRALVGNVLVVASCWPSFEALRDGQGERAAEPGRGAYQVMSLLAPYLVGEARAHLDGLIRQYID